MIRKLNYVMDVVDHKFEHFICFAFFELVIAFFWLFCGSFVTLSSFPVIAVFSMVVVCSLYFAAAAPENNNEDKKIKLVFALYSEFRKILRLIFSFCASHSQSR